ncbi:uncharacterized protein PV09_00187 [Verruconis gallopava]|uniref:Cytochrome b561 domain-containing protein n=1 Tax=Verruconis gallopava TaxID=253628 RepID=A0A0D2BCV9_9PEZI|nr:uncharacterized protein PV09_00187 [Verruconis gallopava]KIW09264.1 hypothetical protein PV09_00187 [Verruconis gallopava]
MRRFWKSLALAAASFSHIASADPEPSAELVERQTTSSSNSSTWVYQGDVGGGNFTFTITVNPQNDDLWFRMAAPSVYSWIGVGVGSQMKDAKVYFMAYQGSSSDKLTISARGPCNKCEPGYLEGFGLNAATPPAGDPAPFGISNSTYYFSGYVANGTRRAGIDPTSTNQPFIWAVGPVYYAPDSDKPNAPLREHSLYGTFQLDMTKAHGTKLPALGIKENGVTFQGTASRDHDFGSPAHAALMGFAFVFILPLGILALRILNRVKLHMIIQGIGLVFVTVAWLDGFYISKKYQRSMHFNSPHQVIGILVYLLLLAQWITGFLHHRKYVKTQQPTVLIKPHKYGLGAVVLGLGIVNMAIGFPFANAGNYNTFYVPIVIGMIIVMIIGISLKRFMSGKRSKSSVPWGGPTGSAVPQTQAQYGAPIQPPQAYAGVNQGGYSGLQYGQRNEVELGQMGPPPAYNGEATKPRELV